ncbi:MAG: tRNA (guanosine(37)-N1)-methyltransferase TrmD [Acidobacteria bacterium]|nr:tRNA (guanosine(37)-N1)-methyltransferase TrmD [Acidobacteriota bacterium]
MHFDILTIFPDFFGTPSRDGNPGTGILGHGILERALRTQRTSVHTHDLRTFTHDRHRTVDDRPFGGGEGMVLKPQPIFECLNSIPITPKASRDTSKESVILLSAQGKPFTQSVARHLSTLDRAILICGRYEGVDERVSQLLCDQELSIGDYVLSGGELGAAIIIDATVRLLPGVLGHADSSRFESFGLHDHPNDIATHDGVPRSTHAAGGILDYPHYTRPADFLNTPIPETLGNGDHLAIRRWRRHAALAKTLANRPDLLRTAALTNDDREYLATLGYTHPSENAQR